MYKIPNTLEGWTVQSVIKIDEDGRQYAIPFDPANTDYANFKKEILADEAQLQDADGKTMTSNKAKEFVATLP
jgi:hypothetical protein